MKKVYILAALALMGQSSYAQIRDFQTTRLNSTAGAGVASILSTEAAILNPAAAAFFDGSSFSYQSYSTKLRKENDERDLNGDQFAKRNDAKGVFMADHSGPVKGGVTYIQQDENRFERERVTLHAAAPIGPNTGMGFAYNYIRDVRPKVLSPRHFTHHALTAGLTQIIDEKTILGLTLVDATRTLKGEERIIGGFQYSLADRFVIIGDAGAQYTKAVDKKYLWRAAVQINVFSDFYVRVGRFYDNVTEFKGTGWGASWMGPRLGVEFAQKFSESFGKNSYIYEDETLVDTSLSAIIKF